MVDMIARKAVYYGRKEYRAGAQFAVDNERDAARLERTNKAQRVPDKPKHVDLPKVKVEEPDEAPKKRRLCR